MSDNQSEKKSGPNRCQHEKTVISEFNNNDVFRENILSKIKPSSSNCEDNHMISFTSYKNKTNSNHKLTKDFEDIKIKHGGDKKPNAKTDVVVEDKNTKEIYKISIKKGKGRITSCKMSELAAFINLIWEDKIFKDNEVEAYLKQKIDLFLEMFTNKNITIGGEGKPNTISELKNTKDDPTVNEYLEIIESLNRLMCDIVRYDEKKNDSKFINALIYQLIRGEVKYGKDSIATADYYLQLDEKFKIINFMDIRKDGTDELHKFYKKIISEDLKNPVQFKSGGKKKDGTRDAWLRFL